MRRFEIQTRGAVGCRIRVILACIGYCEATDRKLHIHWPQYERLEENELFDCKFSDLFTTPYTEDPMMNVGSGDESVLRLDKKSVVLYRANSHRWLLRYCKRPLHHIWNELTPSKAVALEATKLTLPHPIIGIQARHSVAGYENVHYSWHIDRVKQILQSHPHCRVFVSTDSQQACDDITSEFDAISLPKTYKYDHLGIIRHAADLYYLQKCDWVVGSNYSTYSHLAGIIRGGTPSAGDNFALTGGRFETAAIPANRNELDQALHKEK